MGRVIAIINQKGGVGKTTTAVNLASYIAKQGKTVLLIDLDPQGNATSGLGINKLDLKNTVYNCLVDELDINIVRHDTIISGLSIIPTNSDLAGAEIALASVTNREQKLHNRINPIFNSFDFIFIDCPPSLGLLTINALTASSDVIVPVQTEYYAMEGLGQLIQVIHRVQQGLNPTLNILGVVMTMFDSRTGLSEQVKAEIQRVFGDLVFNTVIPRNVRLAEAPSHGKPIMLYDKWSKGARSYKALSKEVMGRV